MSDILPSQTGSEKAGTCDICGGDVPAVTSPYGSVVKGACPSCSEGEQLAAQVAAAAEVEDDELEDDDEDEDAPDDE